jgi:hypothetical protein
MADHEASTIVDVAENVLFDYRADVEHLSDHLPWLTDVRRTEPRAAEAQGMEARRPHQQVHEEVEVTAEVPAGEQSDRTVHSEAWIDIVEENRRLRWGAPGGDDYNGEPRHAVRRKPIGDPSPAVRPFICMIRRGLGPGRPVPYRLAGIPGPWT